MALVTAQDYIYQALRKCGQMRPGYTPPSELLSDALTEWGVLFDEWQAEREMGFSVPTFQFAVTGPGSQTDGNGYLIGPRQAVTGTLTITSPVIACSNTFGVYAGEAISGTGIPAGSTVVSFVADTSITISKNATANGAQTLTLTPDWVAPRPESIVRANNVLTNVGNQPVYLPIRMVSTEEWASLAIQQIPEINVTSLAYYDPQFPAGVFNVFPPLNGNSVQLYTWAALAAPTSLSSTYSAPPAYANAVLWSLAERVWPLCTNWAAAGPNKISIESIRGEAYEAREKVRTVNRVQPALSPDFRGGSPTSPEAGYFDSFVTWTGEPY